MVRRSIIKYSLILLVLFIPTLLWASPPSRIYTYTSGEAINPEEVTANEDAIFSYLNRQIEGIEDDSVTTSKILNGTIVNADIASTANISDTKLSQITTTNKVSTTSLTGTIAASNLSGVTLPSGAVFFMISGSCPNGTTDVTATYSNKFIKVNASQGTSSGTVLTGTSDSHTLSTTEMPAHTHSIPTRSLAGTGSATPASDSGTTSDYTSGSTGGSGGHTHTLSSATTLEPSSIACKMCQVN
jgi:hypothetical protein